MLERIYRAVKKGLPTASTEEMSTAANETQEQRAVSSYMSYAMEVEQTLSGLEAHLHESDDPEDIAWHTLETACRFYDGDWCGLLEIDMELKLWTPFWWHNMNPEDKTSALTEEFESAEFLFRWVAAMRNNTAIIVHDASEVKEDFPEEYALYQRLCVDSIIAVPIRPRPTAFLAVRNPKRYLDRSSMLQLLGFVILASYNEKKMMDRSRMVFTPDNIRSDNDVTIGLFGDLRIYTIRGVLRESDLKSPKISRLLAYLLLNKKHTVPPTEIAHAIWPDESDVARNPAKNINCLVYRLRRMFSLISDRDLVLSTPYGYRLNPELNITTDLQHFNEYCTMASTAASVMNKVSLLEKAVELYQGNILSVADGEHWLIHTSTHYQLSYISAVNELLKTLASLKAYDVLHRYATQALNIAPENTKAYYWLIFSLEQQGMSEIGAGELRAAQQNLTEEEYDELKKMLSHL